MKPSAFMTTSLDGAALSDKHGVHVQERCARMPTFCRPQEGHSERARRHSKAAQKNVTDL
jgi:hypothetical protein